MNKIKLMHGDCLDLMKDIPDRSVDMVMCDPPYGTTGCKWDVVIPFEPMWAQLKRIVKPNGAIVMTASQPFTSALVMSNTKMFKYDWVWTRSHKSRHLQAKRMPMLAHESVLVFYQKPPKYCPIKINGNGKVGKKAGRTNTEAYKTVKGQEDYRRPNYVSKDTVIRGFPVEDRGLHTTQKPVPLMEYLINIYTDKEEVVLDFTMGSGTTGVACLNIGRKFIGIEKGDIEFKQASDRIEKHKKLTDSYLI